MRKTLAVLVCLSATLAFLPEGTAQSITGVFPYSTRGAGGIDLATTHIFIPIPMRRKTGMIPFDFYAYLDSYPAGGAPNDPSPIDTRNFFIVTLAGSGVGGSSEALNVSCGNGKTAEKFSFFTFTDSTGAVHPFDSTIALYSGAGAGSGTCINSTGSSLAPDRSGYTLVLTGGITFQIYDRHGNRVDKGIGDLILDPDGNSLSFSGTSNGGVSFYGSPDGTTNNFTDTLNQLALSHSINSTFTVDTYTYTDSSNQPQTYTITASPFTWNVQSFGCNQLPNQSVFYPTTISTPLGNYSLSYEPAPGGGSGVTTGRISKVTYP